MVAVNKKKLKEQIESKAKIKKEIKKEKDEKPQPKSKVVSGQLKKQLKKKPKFVRPTRGVVFIKNLPHGFYEEQLKAYFSQFGKVTRVRVARSKKTTNSRGFAYIEFQFPEVAQIAAEAMNNYMMFKKVLKTTYIPPEEQKYNYFRSSVLLQTKKDGKTVLTTRYRINQEQSIELQNRLLTNKELEKRGNRTKQKLKQLKAKLAKLDVDYDVDAVTPEQLKSAGKIQSKPGQKIKNESEEESELDESMDVSGLEVDDAEDSGDEVENERHPLDEDSSDEEEDPKLAKKKLNESITKAKKVGKKLQKDQKKKGKQSKTVDPDSDDEQDTSHTPLVLVKKPVTKKFGGIQKKPKKVVKSQVKKLEVAAKKSLNDKSVVKVVDKKQIKKGKSKK